MLNVKNIWIGERIMTIADHQQGTFEGVNKNGMILFKINNQIMLKNANECMLAPEEDTAPNLIYSEETPIVPIALNTHQKNSQIDLHIEVLAPHLNHANPIRILQYQKERCIQFIADCIKDRLPTALIIHGKGEGVLRQEIRHLISNEPKIKLQISVNNDGATEVWFN